MLGTHIRTIFLSPSLISLPSAFRFDMPRCYVNSLLQTYFILPALRHAILSFVPPSLPPAPSTQPPTSPDGASPTPTTPPPTSPTLISPAPTSPTSPSPMDATSSVPPNSPVGARRSDAQDTAAQSSQQAGAEAYKNSDIDTIECKYTIE
jgi:hypothetical protein